jgi:hypothetical protein
MPLLPEKREDLSSSYTSISKKQILASNQSSIVGLDKRAPAQLVAGGFERATLGL